MKRSSATDVPHLSVTSLSQYIRLENCERFLRFRLCPDEEKAMLKKWHLTIQPLTPLLRESGAEFEQEVAQQIAASGEQVVDLQDLPVATTLEWLHKATIKPVILLQASLEADLGNYFCQGRADAIRLHRNRSGELVILIADIKASRHERMEHRLQVAIYAHLIKSMAAAAGLSIEVIEGVVLHLQEDGSVPALTAETPKFDIDTYLTIVERLAIAPDSIVNHVAELSFDEVAYHLTYKCDGCLFNAICMYDSAERLDLSLVPYLSAVEKRVLRAAGIKNLRQLAELMTLPERGSGVYDLKVAPRKQPLVDQLANQWPVGPNLPVLVQRARRALHRFDAEIESSSYLFGAGFGTLPSDEEHVGLIKIFFDAQHDYLQDRVYLISALVCGPKGEEVVVQCTTKPPTEATERNLLVSWVKAVLHAVQKVAAAHQAPIHLYCYNRYDQKVLLEALKRHIDHVAALPAFFDLMTQSPALSQPIISFLLDELEERMNLGNVCAPLHDAARALGFDWKDDDYEYFRLFRAKVFDNRRDVLRQRDGSLVPATKDDPKDAPGRVTIEAASRFNSQIPLEYAYAAWDRLPEDSEDDRLLQPFREVNLDQLKAFAGHRVRALAHIESSFRFKSKFVPKPPLNLPNLAQAASGEIALAQSLKEFLYMEHHAALQANLLIYNLPIERRVQTGLALLLKFKKTESDHHEAVYHFSIVFEEIGLDPVLTMNASRLKEGDWLVLNPADSSVTAGKIKNGRLAIIQALKPKEIALRLLPFTFYRSKFKYPHTNDLEPTVGALYTCDEMADDLNGDKTLEALNHADDNNLYRWLLRKQAKRAVPASAASLAERFMSQVDAIERNHRPTKRQREVIADRLADPLFLVQGPPGTGKSHTVAWSILARMALAAAEGRPFRAVVSCKTHNAVNVVLETLAEKLKGLTGMPTPLTRPLKDLTIYKIANDDGGDGVPRGVTPLNPYNTPAVNLKSLLQQKLLVIGATPGGLYNLNKYTDEINSARKVDWSLRWFDLVVIDEASQMSLPEGILACAFMKKEGQVIVVGDHRQMPPIIAHAWEEEENRSATAGQPYLSLFESLIERGFERVPLDESFRLHSVIADFLEENIYAGDDIGLFSKRTEVMAQPPVKTPFVDAVLDPNYPIVVVEHTEQGSQQYNETEVSLITPLIDVCVNNLRLDGKDGIGVVVPHRAQKGLLRERFPDLAATNSIDTVERFQGGERNVIIVSATASDPDYVLAEADFLLNLNRLNVALSRPRHKLIVVASRAVIDLLTSDLDIFENAVIWKRLYYQYAADILWQGRLHGVAVTVRGKSAVPNSRHPA